MSGPLPSETFVTGSARSRAEKAVLDFEAARDGFGFANVFTWTEDDLDVLTSELGPLLKGFCIGLPALLGRVVGGKRGLFAGAAAGAAFSLSTISPTLVRRLARRWSTFGMCGGMALLAKERWERGATEATAELHRDALRPILRLHQARTIRASWPGFLKFWLQARLFDGVVSRDELSHEAERAIALLDAGGLVVLGLVGDTPDPFATHQVLAFGYENHTDGTDFHVYDPNGPGRTRHVVIREAEGHAVLETDLPTGPRKGGGYHISRTAGTLSMLFVVDV